MSPPPLSRDVQQLASLPSHVDNTHEGHAKVCSDNARACYTRDKLEGAHKGLGQVGGNTEQVCAPCIVDTMSKFRNLALASNTPTSRCTLGNERVEGALLDCPPLPIGHGVCGGASHRTLMPKLEVDPRGVGLVTRACLGYSTNALLVRLRPRHSVTSGGHCGAAYSHLPVVTCRISRWRVRSWHRARP